MQVERVIDLSSGGNGSTIYYVLLPVLAVFFYHVTSKMCFKLERILTIVKEIKRNQEDE